jgi:hypothetical protein
MIAVIRKVVFGLIGIHGLAIAGNAVLSLIFLRKWKKEQAAREEEETTLDI